MTHCPKQHMEKKLSGIISIENKEVSTYNLDLITMINYKETGPLSKQILSYHRFVF